MHDIQVEYVSCFALSCEVCTRLATLVTIGFMEIVRAGSILVWSVMKTWKWPLNEAALHVLWVGTGAGILGCRMNARSCTVHSFAAAPRRLANLMGRGVRKLRNTLVRMASDKSGASYLKNAPKLVFSFFFLSFLPFLHPSLPRSSLWRVARRSRGLAHHFGQTYFLSLSLSLFLPTRNERNALSPLHVLDTTREESVAILGGYRQYLCFQVAVPVACVLAWWKCVPAAF